MSNVRKGLGKGLGALIEINEKDDNITGVKELKINEIEPNKDQPRKTFNDEKLYQLAESIKLHGVFQPIIVKKENDTYKIIAGERRWRAARIAGLSTIPVIIKELTDRQVMEIALIENLQRQDLNPIEEAEAFEKLVKDYKMTQEDLSIVVGKSRSSITNSMRLLGLNDTVKQYLINGDITSGHARALLSINNKELQTDLAADIINNDLTVRETESLVKKFLNSNAKNKLKKNKSISNELIEVQNKLQCIFGTKVKLMANKKKGKIMIEYYSNEELDRIINMVSSIQST